MNDNYVLSCCSTCDLSAEKLSRLGIAWIPFHFSVDGVDHLDDFGASLSHAALYDAMAKGAKTKTSQVNVAEYRRHFSQLAKEHANILHVCLSSGLSGTIDPARIAADDVMAEHPGLQIAIVDSLSASSGYGLLMQTLAEKKREGLSFEEAVTWVNAHRLELHHWFFSTDLSYYVKGGRISKTAGLVGQALKICPLLCMDKQGHLCPQSKIRTKKRASQAALNMMLAHAKNKTDYSGKAFICHSECLEDAKLLASDVSAHFPALSGPVELFDIGPTIGSHTGPGTVSLFFWGDVREA